MSQDPTPEKRYHYSVFFSFMTFICFNMFSALPGRGKATKSVNMQILTNTFKNFLTISTVALFVWLDIVPKCAGFIS